MPMSGSEIKSGAQVLEDLRSQGITVRQWSRDHGAPERTVYAVIRGDNKGRFGEAHRVAVLLGMKKGELS